MHIHLIQRTQDIRGLLHADVLHRDIKPANVLVESRTGHQAVVRLADFGLAGISTGPACFHKPVGTTAFLAPEVLRENSAYGAPANVYAVALVFYTVLTGNVPFEGVDGKCYVGSSIGAHFWWSCLHDTASQQHSACKLMC